MVLWEEEWKGCGERPKTAAWRDVKVEGAPEAKVDAAS
jgi:hypothetical protein